MTGVSNTSVYSTAATGEEQRAMADNRLYDLLGVSRNASDSEIRKVSGEWSNYRNIGGMLNSRLGVQYGKVF